MENEDQWPTVKSHPTSFHPQHITERGSEGKLCTQAYPASQQVTLLLRTDISGREQGAWAQPQSEPSGSFLSLGAALRSPTYQPGDEDRNLVIYTLQPRKPRRQRYIPSPQLPESMSGSKFFPPSQDWGAEWGWGGEEREGRTFLVAQWIKVHLPMQGTRVWSWLGN